MTTDCLEKKYWRVAFHVDATGWIVVKAMTEGEAREIAESEFFPDFENTEIGDAQEIVDVLEITKERHDRARNCTCEDCQ